MSERVDPFVGLAPYAEQDAEWFFGREREVELIAANLRAARLTLLYGGSGVGKSSVLLAGVMPRLHRVIAGDRERALAVAARGDVALADPPSIAVAIFRDWRDAPLPRLAAAIRTAVVEATGNTALEPWDGEEPLADRLREYTRHVRGVLVVLDQFEEYFMYHPNDDGPGTLAGELPELLDEPDLRVNVLLGLREDALSRLDRFKGRIPDLFGNYLRLDYLERDAARVAIEEPVRRYNETVRAGRPPVRVHESLVDAVLDGVRAGRLALHAPADQAPRACVSTRVETPYLQLVMRRLWAEGTAGGKLGVTTGTLDGLGGAAAIVSSHLGEAMDRLSQDEQAVAADVFGFLVTPSRTKIAHTAEDLAVWAGRPAEEVTSVLRDLAGSDRRILRSVPPTSEEERERYELYHDVLAEAVHEWSSRNQERRRVTESRRQRRRRWRRRAVLGLAWTSGLAAAVGVFAIIDDDERRAAKAEMAERASRELAGKADGARDTDPELSVLLALAARDRSHTPEAEQALRQAVSASRLRAAYRGAPPLPCSLACSPFGRTREPDAVSLRVATPESPFAFFDETAAAQGDDPSLSLAPSGRTIALVAGGRVKLWAPATGTIREVRGARRVVRAAFIGRGSRLLLVTKGRDVLLADARTARRTAVIASGATFAAASADGRIVATGHGGGVARVLRLGSPEPTTLRLGGDVTSLAFSPADPRMLAIATVGSDTGVSLVRWPSDARRFVRVDDRRMYLSDIEARFSDDGRRLLVTTDYPELQVLDVATARRLFTPSQQLDAAEGFDPQSRRLIEIENNVAKLWDASSGRPAGLLGGHEYPIRTTAFSPSGSLIATGAEDGSARVWDAASGNAMLDLRSGTAAITAVAFSPNGRFLITADDGGDVRIWDVRAGTRLRGGGSGGLLTDADFSADGTKVIGAWDDGRITSWRSADGRGWRRLHRLRGRRFYAVQLADDTVGYARQGRPAVLETQPLEPGGPVRRLRLPAAPFWLSQGGDHMLVLGRSVRVADLRTGDSVVLAGRKRSQSIYRGAISPDGRLAMLAGDRVELVDTAHPAVRRVLDDPAVGLSGWFSPDSRMLVTEGEDALVWDTSTGKVVHRLGDHVGSVTSATFSPDGSRIVTGGEDRTIRIWDAATGSAQGVIDGYRDLIVQAEIDPTGRYVLAQTGYGTPQLSACTPCLGADELERLARRHLTRGLTRAERADARLRRP